MARFMKAVKPELFKVKSFVSIIRIEKVVV